MEYAGFAGRAAAGLIWVALCASLCGGAQARDRAGDGVFSSRRSMHFVLQQDVERTGPGGSQAFEREILAELEAAYQTLSDTLGMRPGEKVVVRIYAAERFDREFAGAFAFRAAGLYDGVIHVRGGDRLSAQQIHTLHHEYVHAVIAAQGGRFPVWINEGLAEYFGYAALGVRGLAPGQRAELIGAAHDGYWIPLAELAGAPFSHLEEGSAGLAYRQAHAVVDWLVRRRGPSGLRRLCERLERTSAERALERIYGMDLDELDAAVRGDLGAGG